MRKFLAILAVLAVSNVFAEVNVALKCDLTAVETDMFMSEKGWTEYQMVDGLAIAKTLADSSGYVGFVTHERVGRLAQDFQAFDIRIQKFSMDPGEVRSVAPSNTRGL